MKAGEFIFNDVSSLEYNAVIQERPSIPSAGRKINMKELPGVSGTYIFDEEAFNNVSFSLKCFLVGKNEEELKQHKADIVSLLNVGTYTNMELYHDDEYIYEVMVTDSIDFEQSGKTPLLLEFSINLSAKPFKRLKNVETKTGTSVTVNNPYDYSSKPRITLYGTGDMQLIVNDVEYPFKEIDEHVVIDSEIQHAYKQETTRIRNRNNKMYTVDFPVLKPGDNTLSLKGGATRMEVKPRWVVKL